MRKCRGGEIFPNHTQAQFLQVPGDRTNTSAEQLPSTSIAIDCADYLDAAQYWVLSLAASTGQGDTQDREDEHPRHSSKALPRRKEA